MGKNTGGPAFPAGMVKKSRPMHDPGAGFRVTDDISPKHEGMSLRDYFAANAPVPQEVMALEQHCAYRYRYADAMLKAREAA